MNILEKMQGKKPEPVSKIRPTRNIRITLADGDMTDGLAGQEYDVPKSDADYLVGSGSAERILNTEELAEHDRRKALIPAPHQPRPLPDQWSNLPESFAKYWNLSERLRCLEGRRFECEIAFLRGSGLTEEERTWLINEITALNPASRSRARLLDERVARSGLKIRQVTERDLEDRRRMRDALERLGQDVDDFRTAHLVELTELRMECGSEAIKANLEAVKASQNLADVGFQIFATRLTGLGLSELKLAELFDGSADAIQYMHPVANPQGLRFGWADEAGVRRDYLAIPVEQMVSRIHTYQAETERLNALLVQAKATLTKTQSISGEFLPS